ncbi:MAG: hypothetical protein ACRDTC_15900 [Pseudonocardiaceae bacterium]
MINIALSPGAVSPRVAASVTWHTFTSLMLGIDREQPRLDEQIGIGRYGVALKILL